MALSLKSNDADRLARELAATTGESITEAVTVALRERLDRERARRSGRIVQRLARLTAEVGTLPVVDGRSADDILGYDEHGLPR